MHYTSFGYNLFLIWPWGFEHGLTFWLLELKADCPSISVVFMGSEKYPDENAFDAFIKKHGGSDNASTDCERVC